MSETRFVNKSFSGESSAVDFLVVGSGIAGLSTALKASYYGSVAVVTKAQPAESATVYAQGGIAAALGQMDNPEKHKQDTLEAGAGLCDPEAVDVLVHEGVQRVKELIELGMEFTRDATGELHLGREGGHGMHRVVHAYDYTGKELQGFMLKRVHDLENVHVFPTHMAVDLITEHQLDGSNPKGVYGAYILDEKTQEIFPVKAKVVVLAAGGSGRIYPVTTNPSVSTADGIALAYRAGCRVRNLEFVQFHPTALVSKRDPAFLISEALRGAGGILRNQEGQPFMQDIDRRADLAPRDVVARAIDAELKRSGAGFVYLDVTQKSAQEIKEHFPLIAETVQSELTIDITKQYIPVVPAAHYFCGGVLTDLSAQTDLENLYAVGETASTGVHGANRLASNSLLEGLVFAHRLVENVATRNLLQKPFVSNLPEWSNLGTENLEEWILIRHDLDEIKHLTYDYVGIVRSRLRMQRALRRIDLIYEEVQEFYRRTQPQRGLLELRNLALVAQLLARSALSRHESRGLHYVTDYPENRFPSREDTILIPRIKKQP